MKRTLRGWMAGVALFSGVSGWGRLPSFKRQADDFFYAQQTALWVYFKVPKAKIRERLGASLDALGFESASFEDPDSGYLALKPMVFSAEFGAQTAAVSGMSHSTEMEVTLLVVPRKAVPPAGRFRDFLAGRKMGAVGQLRLDVLCDNDVAVAAGRAKFGEHKYLTAFEYTYPTANQNVGKAKPFQIDMTLFTWGGANEANRKILRLEASLKGLKPLAAVHTPELLYSAFPPEPQPAPGIRQRAVGEYRHYGGEILAFSGKPVKVTFGDAQGAQTLSPVVPFGDGKAIAGSELWPVEMRDRTRELLSQSEVEGFWLFQPSPAEYETKPFDI